MSDTQRVDKWLWAARFFKTRGLAQDAVEAGQVRLRGARIKSSRGVQVNDILQIKAGGQEWEVVVKGLSAQRGPAVFARTLYDETPDGMKTRLEQLALKKLEADPSNPIKGRPTKHDRRAIDQFRGKY